MKSFLVRNERRKLKRCIPSSIEHQTLKPSFGHQALDSFIYFCTLNSSFGHQVRLLFHFFSLTFKLGSFLASLRNLKHLQMLSLDDNKLSNLPKFVINGKATINYYYKWKCCNKILWIDTCVTYMSICT